MPNAVNDILAHDGPAVLDVVTAKQELSMPPTIGIEQIKGFSLWAVRAVMSGRGDEVVDSGEREPVEEVRKNFFFEKKEAKNFCEFISLARRGSAQTDESFLLLFFKKEVLAYCIRSAGNPGIPPSVSKKNLQTASIRCTKIFTSASLRT